MRPPPKPPSSASVVAAMSALLGDVTNAIWHAFAALQHDGDGLVNKSKLKVLTANIGTLLDLYGVERGLDHYKSTSELDFASFKYYLYTEVFSAIPDTFNFTSLRNYEEKIEEVCWLICRKLYSQRQKPIFSDTSVYQIFRIFCLLADLIPDELNTQNFQVLLEPTEAGVVAEQLVNSLGLTWDQVDWDNFTNSIGPIRFSTFIAILESKCRGLGIVEQVSIVEAIEEIYQIFIKDVIKKGFLLKKGYLLPTLREYWFVLQPCELNYYKSPSEKYLCGSISLTPNSLVEVCQTSAKPQKFLLTTTERSFELATQDHKSRLQWTSALQLAIEHSKGKHGYQREQKNRRLDDVKRRNVNAKEAQKTKILLVEEKKARLAAENQAQEYAALAEEENKRLLAMKTTQTELERLLAEETQAKRDEEIVRALQARVLAEEWDKREELERLQEEQRHLLTSETLKRKQFEELQKIKEIQLKEAEDRLKQLESDRQKLDEELRIARNKVRHSEESQQILEEQLIVMYPTQKEGDKIRRAVSFMPSSGDKTAPILQARAATLRKHSKKENGSPRSLDFNLSNT